jgi:putative aminopeptidase FrvX
MRVAVGVSLDVVEASLQRAVDVAASGFGSEVVLERLGGFPGAATARDAWIVRAAIRAWESRTGRIHSEATSTSGVTDASILRGHGIPTARIGMPRPTIPSPYPGFSMGVVDIDSIAALARTLVEIVMDATRRPRAEVVDLRGASMQIES